MSSASDDDGGGGDVKMELADTEFIQTSPFKPFTKAERIQQLNDIDMSITELLRSARLAIETLTTFQTSNDSKSDHPEDDRQTLTDATDSYLQSLHSVDVRLKRQINGLEEAGIIPRESESDQKRPEGQATASERKAGLDVGWLNSRSGKVGREMEAELWAKTREYLEKMDRRATNGYKADETSGPKEDITMSD